MFNENISKKLGFYSVLSGLISGILLFPDQTFSKSILIGNLIPTVYFPSWISTALLFWSFIVATFVPMIVVFTNIKKTNHFSFKKISQKVKRIR